ncbi:hypothetical protein WICMUC_001122 [Wickerhamomyces mucosus]|uniref:HAT C-terminal dimerisation domain-containing protein n=1 Tax=Wickerhamomyces mucosus TaxID=1378264 RepID=A0A9P8PVX6_9ASCO|nr:hypothetical protein WICMUC_001122 [Wickerhamomyces mucosus]
MIRSPPNSPFQNVTKRARHLRNGSHYIDEDSRALALNSPTSIESIHENTLSRSADLVDKQSSIGNSDGSIAIIKASIMWLLVEQNLPFYFVEKESFKELMRGCGQPKKIITLNSKDIAAEFRKTYDSLLSQLKGSLENIDSISLSFDIWTSEFNTQFLAVFYYCSDENFQYKEGLLGFLRVAEDDSEAKIANRLYFFLQRLNVADKIISLCGDSVSKHGTLAHELERVFNLFSEKRTISSLFRSQSSFLRSVYHSIKLMTEPLLGFDAKENDYEEIDFHDISNVGSKEDDNFGIEDELDEMNVQSLNYLTQRIDTKKLNSPILKLRAIMKIIKSTPKIFSVLKDQSSEKEISSVSFDLNTTWNSTLEILSYGICYQRPINRLIHIISKCPDTYYGNSLNQLRTIEKYKKAFEDLELTDYDWQIITVFRGILQKFKLAVLALCRSESSSDVILEAYYYLEDFFRIMTSENSEDLEEEKKNLYESLGIDKVMNDLKDLPDDLKLKLKESANIFREYYNITDQSDLIYATTILDPRLKETNFKIRLPNESEEIMKYFKSHFEKIYQSLDSVKANYTDAITNCDATSELNITDCFLDSFLDISDKQDEMTNCYNKEYCDFSVEFERYIDEKPLSVYSEINVLNWWASNAAVYPRLSKVAKVFFSIPSSSASTEKAFSIAKGALESESCSSSSQFLSRLMFLKCSEAFEG